ncbi:hypothetical protein HQ585_02765 [candidate division KSB1 bacterium]|nr:hypothetical protein [candidate division KSB1 bacterium]
MDASLFNIGIGLAVYAAHRFTGSLNPGLRLILFILTGMIAATLSQIIGWSHMDPAMIFPVWIALLAGGLTGALLYWAQAKQLFTQSNMKYSATILLAIVHSLLAFGLFNLLSFVLNVQLILTDQSIYVMLPLILYSFVSILGFSLPLRIFNPNNSKTQ